MLSSEMPFIYCRHSILFYLHKYFCEFMKSMYVGDLECRGDLHCACVHITICLGHLKSLQVSFYEI